MQMKALMMNAPHMLLTLLLLSQKGFAVDMVSDKCYAKWHGELFLMDVVKRCK